MYNWLLSNLWRKARLVFALLIAFSAAISPATPTLGGQPTSQPNPPTMSNEPANQAFPLTDPEIIVGEDVNTYTITNGLLYWGLYCNGGEFVWPGYLRRAPSHGGARLTLQETTVADCVTFWHMAADETGVYYANLEDNRMEFRAVNTPGTVDILYSGSMSINMTTLVLTDSYIFWGDFSLNRVYRMPKEGGSRIVYAYTGAGLRGVVEFGGLIYYMDNGGLWECGASSCSSPTHRSDSTGGYLRSTQWGLYWVEQSNPPKIHHFLCFMGCADTIVYTAPTNYTIYNTALGLCTDLSNYCLFWTEKPPVGYSRLQRKTNPFSAGGTLVTIADNLPSANIIATDDQGVYFQLPSPNTNHLGRLPYTATEVQRDLQAHAWEVTQTIQSLSNDVPLVAHKTTYVRLYPELTGEHANFVQAELRGWHGAVEFPDSPLAPLDGTIDLDESYAYDRSDPYSGYLFQLPDSWTEAGAVTLQGIVDPDAVYADQLPANNALAGVFTFGNKPPVCDIFIPVRTHTPAARVELANFWRGIDMQKKLWPVPDVWVYYQNDDVTEPEFCWKWGFIPWVCDGPYELEEGTSWDDWVDDEEETLLHIGTRAAFSDDPDECDDLDSAVHYIGMVHPAAQSDWGGMAYIYDWMQPASWVKLPPLDANPPLTWSWPYEGANLAHETSHNHERAHVDCEDPADPGYYPYPPCQLDDTDDPTHFGFDVNTLMPITQTMAADYMSYADYRWASDFTYKAMYNRIPIAQNTAAPRLAAATHAVLVSGEVNLELGIATLHYAWVYPTAGMSLDMLEKWDTMLAQPYQQGQESPEVVNYHLQLLDSGGVVLADYNLTPLDVEVHKDEIPGVSFMQTFDAPAGVVARMQLMADASVLVSRAVGIQEPIIQILLPAGGETFSDEMTISWQASDPDGDILLFNLQYSPDGGLTWKSIGDEVIGNPDGETSQLVIDDLGALGASNGATGLIRVAASDGYHTTLATSNAFTVQDQPPKPYIVSPQLAHLYPAGESIPLRGGAADPETGSLSGDQLDWVINGVPVGSGEENDVYGLAPGSYLLGLQATDPAANTANAYTLLNIGRLSIPMSSSTPTLDGLCEDAAYGDLVVRLLPDGYGNQAMVALVRKSGSLWACFTGMRYIAGQPPGMVGLFADVDNSRDEQAQPDDYGFLVSENGTPLSMAGNGSGGYTLIGLEGMQAQVSVNAGTWSAELNIPSERVGDWSHPMGMYLVAVYNWSFSADNVNLPEGLAYFPWPYASNISAPNTWAWTLLGTAPVITSLSPDTVTAGGPAFTLTIWGEGFQDGAVANLGTTPLPTTYVSSSQLTAQVSASLIATSGYPLITVTNADTLVSDPVILTVENPAPAISRLSPSQQNTGSTAFTLSVIGSGFVSGAQVVWNGAALETTFVSSTQLQATIAADELEDTRQVSVLVQNPQPGGGTSNIKTFSIRGLIQFLPVVQRGR